MQPNCFVKVLNGPVILLYFAVGSPAIVISLEKTRFQFYGVGKMFNGFFIFLLSFFSSCRFFASFLTNITVIKLCVGIPMNVLVFNKSMEVVVDGCLRNSMVRLQVL